MKRVQAAVCLDDFQARAQPQVEGVAQNDLRVHFLELARRIAFTVRRSHRHENRRLDHAVIERDAATAGWPSVPSIRI